MKKILFAFMAFMLAFTSCQQSTGSDEAGVSPTPPSPTTEATEYTVSVTQPDFGGTVSVDKSKAKASETITITTTANDGFELETISMKNGEATVTVTDKKFTMPSGNVTVNAAFAASSYTVKWDNGIFENKFSLAKVKAYITQIGLVETTHYSIDKKNGVLTFTSVGYEKVVNYLNTNGEPTVTETPTTPTTDGGEDNNDNVVYGSKQIILPTVEHGTIKITNKSGTKAYKDGNTVLSNAGADAGDVIELTLVPDTGYKYFAYENTLTVTSIGSVTLTESTKANVTSYTFEMPNNDVEVNGLPFGFEKDYSATFSTPEKDGLNYYYYINIYSGFRWLNKDKVTFKPGTKVYVKAYKQTLYEAENGSFEDVTTKIKSDYANGSVTIDGLSISFPLKEEHKFYSFIMPRNDITLKFNLIQQ